MINYFYYYCVAHDEVRHKVKKSEKKIKESEQPDPEMAAVFEKAVMVASELYPKAKFVSI